MKRRNYTVRIMLVAAIIMVASVLLMPATAKADTQGLPYTLGAATNMPSQINTATASNQTSVVTLRANRGLGLTWLIGTPGVATGTLWVYPSVDGTNFATSPLGTISATATSTLTNIVAVGQWSRASLEGYTAVSLSTVSNSSSSLIITNKGVIWGFPNN